MRLRDVEMGDGPAYVRMRCDPEIMAHLGGPFSRDRAEAQVARDVDLVASGNALIKMIVVDSPKPKPKPETGPEPETEPESQPEPESETVAGTVTLWRHEVNGSAGAEIGWLVLPAYQGRGLARRAVSTLLGEARRDGRWGVVHAFPGVDNTASNRLCRTLGFTLVGVRDTPFRDQVFRTNHWTIDLH
ncbi:GNAT family N-acetyltransferase [Micromonospora cathayae]|uniref:GNAT family N-acetyltransferase n=1 Tax=Micromonospora cathayae TaxID=3028804 RepID=A0ABY7ZR09_9ACTN|nr:GNAT family N-acetyltransferase [Micromonospora sp. HUAS 3]WDZ85397.1 GNAT family N-acetyltransferase [Micromonospora sp. HUAS 3]